LSGQKTLDISANVTDGEWTTNAVGGFGAASFSLPGHPKQWVRDLPKLCLIRVLMGTTVLWEGQLEDHLLVMSEGDMHTEIQCFGLGRLLAENSARRIWVKRDLNWTVARTLSNTELFTGSGINCLNQD